VTHTAHHSTVHLASRFTSCCLLADHPAQPGRNQA